MIPSIQASGQLPRVLVVEDEMLIAMELEAILIGGGYEVIGPAPTVSAAIALLNRQRPDAGVLDVNLRGEMVTPLAIALRAMEIPFLLSSAYEPVHLNDYPVLREANNIGKPASRERLLTSLASVLQGTR